MLTRAGLGCAGDVQVARSEEGYDKWGIHILVSYRDTEPLQILTGTTQSGGVRPPCRTPQRRS